MMEGAHLSLRCRDRTQQVRYSTRAVTGGAPVHVVAVEAASTVVVVVTAVIVSVVVATAIVVAGVVATTTVVAGIVVTCGHREAELSNFWLAGEQGRLSNANFEGSKWRLPRD
jgi:hypothetical protein